MTQVIGNLVRIRQYDFTDEKTGEQVKGAKLTLLQEPEQAQNGLFGMQEINVSARHEDAQRLMSEAKGLVLEPVSVECEVVPRARGVGLRAISLKSAAKAAA